MNWTSVPFGELYAEPSRNGVYKSKEHHGSGVKIVNMGELFAYDMINGQDMKRLRMSDAEMQKSGLAEGDLLFGRRSLVESGAGKCSIVEGLTEATTFESSIIRVRVDQSRVRPRFLFYWLKSPVGRGRVRAIVTGTNVKGIRGSVLQTIDVVCPALQIQDYIVSVLRPYDDLIENNRRRIQLLEQAARLLYKEWFVHLRFPGHEHVKITDGVPEGWEMSTVGAVCSSFDDGDWIETKDQGGEDFRLLQISNIGDNEFVETGNFRYVTSETSRRLRCNEVVPGDILISRMPKPIGRAWYVTDQPWRMITAVDATIARPDPEIIDPFYYLYHLNSPLHIARCELRATGATRPRVTRKNMGALPILVPPKSIQANFGEIASKANRQREILTRQNRSLVSARDLLLPRLMNGEIPV